MEINAPDGAMICHLRATPGCSFVLLSDNEGVSSVFFCPSVSCLSVLLSENEGGEFRVLLSFCLMLRAGVGLNPPVLRYRKERIRLLICKLPMNEWLIYI